MTIYCLNFGLRLKILFISKIKTNLVFSKLEQLKQIMQNKVDILVLTETKIDLVSQTINSVLMNFVYHFGWIGAYIEQVS